MAIVYIDTLFLTNFACDFFLLYLTRTICKDKSRTYRMIVGALIGAVYSVLMFCVDVMVWQSILASVFVSALIVYVSFKSKTAKEFLTVFAVFYFASFILAGISYVVFFAPGFTGITEMALSNGVFYFNINPWAVIVGAALCFLLLFAVERVYTKRLVQAANMHNVTITYNNKSINIKALLDTGNHVCDPVTGIPVVVCEIQKILPLFEGEDFYRSLCKMRFEADYKLLTELVCATPFRLVPYITITQGAGLMLAFIPDKIEIDKNEVSRKILIGISVQNIGDESYNALLHPKVI